MSDIVRIWEDEANLAGEIELTDAQLSSVCGACDGKKPLFLEEKHTTTISVKKVVFFLEDTFAKKDDNDNYFIRG